MKTHGLFSKKPETRRVKLDCECGLDCGRTLEIFLHESGN